MTGPRTKTQQIVRMRTGGHVRRCHGILHNGEYRVDSHSWGVAMLMWALWPEDFQRLSIYCLTHDAAEAWVGDIPATTKRYNDAIRTGVHELEARVNTFLGVPDEAELSDIDREKIKNCDLLELYLWTCEQVHAGNRHAMCVKQTVEDFIDEKPFLYEAAEIYRAVRNDIKLVEHTTYGLIRKLSGDKE